MPETTKLFLWALRNMGAPSDPPPTHPFRLYVLIFQVWVVEGRGGGVTAAEYNIDTLLTDVSTLAFLANARFALFQCGSSYPCEWVSQWYFQISEMAIASTELSSLFYCPACLVVLQLLFYIDHPWLSIGFTTCINCSIRLPVFILHLLNSTRSGGGRTGRYHCYLSKGPVGTRQGPSGLRYAQNAPTDSNVDHSPSFLDAFYF